MVQVADGAHQRFLDDFLAEGVVPADAVQAKAVKRLQGRFRQDFDGFGVPAQGSATPAAIEDGSQGIASFASMLFRAEGASESLRRNVAWRGKSFAQNKKSRLRFRVVRGPSAIVSRKRPGFSFNQSYRWPT